MVKDWGDRGKRTVMPQKLLFPAILNESPEAPSSGNPGWKFWKKDLSPEISGISTLDYSYIIDNFVFTVLVVVPVGKCK